MITRHDQMMLAALQQIGRELKRANDLKEQENKKINNSTYQWLLENGYTEQEAEEIIKGKLK
jgi:hypothetical protein